jgi:hypothetical protein
MKRPFYAFIIEIYDLLSSSFKVFKKHKMISAYAIAIFIFALAVWFIFVSYAQTISPFVYPLF